MSISRELFLSILAMDSYNQSYEAGIEHGKTKIGAAQKAEESDTVQSAATSERASDGFYALTYTVDGSQIDDWSSQTEVLSFRGTNSPIDYLTGWFIGAGDIFLEA